MRTIACGEHLKHIVCLQHVHETEIIDAHNGLGDSCTSRSQHMQALINSFDWKRLPAAELERHDLQHGRDNHKHGE